MGNSVEQLELDEPLVIEANPFGGAEARWVASPVQTALAELIRQIDCRRRLIIVAGKAGTGKTLLTDMVVRVCSDMGLSTCRIDRGDLADVALRDTSDVVVVDEADSITDLTVQAFLSPDGKTATCVFLCLPTAVHRFCCPDTYVVDLHSLPRSDARTYLLERAKSIGHPHLFAPDALDLVIYRARGSFRLLRSIASLAFFDAAHEGETQIAVRHVAYALELQMAENVDENDIAPRSRISHGDRADEADPPQDQPVVDALETLTSHVDEGANLHADVSHSDSADEFGTDPRQPIGGALESPTPYVDEERIDLGSEVLRNKSACQTETNQRSQPESNWHRLIPYLLRNGNERVEHPWRRTAIRRPIGLAVEPIPDIGTGPYRLSARMRKASDDPVSPVKSVGQELRDERERQGKQLDDVWRALKIRPNYLAAIEEGRFEDLPGRAFTIGYVGRYIRYLQLDVEKLQERLEAEIAAHGGVFNDRIDIEPLPKRKFPVIGMAVAGLLLVALIYSRDDVVSLAARTFEQATEEGLAQNVVDAPVSALVEQQTQVAAPDFLLSLPFEVVVAEPVSLRAELLPPLPVIAVTPAVSLRPDLPLPVIVVTPPVSLRPDLPLPVIAVTPPVSLRSDLPLPVIAVTPAVSLRPDLPLPVIAVTPPVSLRPDLPLPVIVVTPAVSLRPDLPLPVIAVTPPVSLRPDLPLPVITVTPAVSLRPDLPLPVIAVTPAVSLRPDLPLPVIAVTPAVSLRPDLPLPVIAVTPAVSLRPDLPLPVIAVTPAVSLRPDLPLPVIAVTQPVSLRADLTPAAVRQALIAAAAPVQGDQAQLPPGRRYGLQNRNSRITLRVHNPTIVAIRDARNRVFIDRKLAPGDTYRVPNLVGLWLTAIDASAVEIVLDGASVGFAGEQRATVWDLSLNPQSIANSARRTSSQAGSAPAVQAARSSNRKDRSPGEGEPLK